MGKQTNERIRQLEKEITEREKAIAFLQAVEGEIVDLRLTVGSLLWLDNLDSEDWLTLQDEIIPVLAKEMQRRQEQRQKGMGN